MRLQHQEQRTTASQRSARRRSGPMSRKFRRQGRRRAVVLIVAGAVLLVGSAGILFRMWAYRRHAASAASRLVQDLNRRERAATKTPPRPVQADTGTCSAPPPSSPAAGNGARMIIAASSINLRAPVLPDINDSQLDVGVGHLPSSRWPDEGGTSVLEAHDVTFFSRLADLRPGADIELTAPCRQWVYRVLSGRVVRKGTPVVNTPAPRLVLVTCWPTNALYLTDERYVLTADLVSSTNTDTTNVRLVGSTVVPSAVLPQGLPSSDVTPDAVGVPEGTLAVTGSMDPASSASAEVLSATSNAFSVFDVGLLAAEHHKPAWWRAETGSGHPLPPSAAAPLDGLRPRWRERVNVVLTGSGTTINSADMTSVVEARRELYRLNVHLDQVDGRYVITRWEMAPTP